MVDVDVLVVGCGPSGSFMSLLASMDGFKVAVIERKHTPENPTVCGEYLPRFEAFTRALPTYSSELRLIRSWLYSSEVQSNITSKIILDLENRRFSFDFEGVVISRKKLVNLLVDQALGHGCRTIFGSRYLGSRLEGDSIVSRTSDGLTIRSHFIVGADGYPSRVGFSLNIGPKIADKGVAVVTSQLVKHSLNPEKIYMRFSKNVPGGYSWVIPLNKSYGRAGIGFTPSTNKINVRGVHASTIKSYGLKPAGPLYGKLLPVGGMFKNISGRGGLLVGDAAGAVMPVNGGGIPLAMLTSAVAYRTIRQGNLQLYEPMLEPLSRLLRAGDRARRFVSALMESGVLFDIFKSIIPSKFVLDVISMDPNSFPMKIFSFSL